MENFLEMSIGIPLGIKLFGQKDYHELLGFTVDGERYVSNRHWMLHIEMFNDCEPDEQVKEFLNDKFTKNENWLWTPFMEQGLQEMNAVSLTQATFSKETSQVEVTAVSYHPNSNLQYRIGMISGDEIRPIFIDEQYLRMFELCGLTHHATGGSCDAVVLKGPDATGNIYNYGFYMPCDVENCNSMALEVFQVLNKYPDVTIDPNHFNILGIKPPTEEVTENA